MRGKLIAVQLWEEKDARDPSSDVTCAWKVLARLGVPYRYAGKAPDGGLEYLVLDPENGMVHASGRGRTPAQAMCAAALAACTDGRPHRLSA